MNSRIIQKVIDELKKESPSIPYVLGILETLLESFPDIPAVKVEYKPLAVTDTNPSGTRTQEIEDVPQINLNHLDEIKRLANLEND